MSNSSIEGKLKGLQERFENEMRFRRDGAFNQGGMGTPRPGSARRPRPREYLLSPSPENQTFRLYPKIKHSKPHNSLINITSHQFVKMLISIDKLVSDLRIS